ncbi:MAG: SMC-Scp complex subunit ScpB [Thermodesulfobacteriota bacterium]
MDKETLKPIIESIIFASEEPVSLERIVNIIDDAERATVREAARELVEDYSRREGLRIEEVAGGYQFRTPPEYAPYLRKLFKIGARRISKAAMEALAVVAYKQPVTKAEVDAIRGVDSGGVLASLLDKRFIKIVGRKDVPGRPVVYASTKEFLETFDLKDLSCLPSLKDIQMMEESDEGTEGPEGDAGDAGGAGGESSEGGEGGGWPGEGAEAEDRGRREAAEDRDADGPERVQGSREGTDRAEGADGGGAPGAAAEAENAQEAEGGEAGDDAEGGRPREASEDTGGGGGGIEA